VALVAAAGLAAPLALAAQDAGFHGDPELTEWEVPYAESRPRDPYVGPDGRVWFVGQRSHYVAALDPASGDFTRYDLDDGTGPHNLIVGDDGTIWYAGNRASHIGRLDPASGEIEKFMMPDERAQDPHTLVWTTDGEIWFTVQGGNMVGHFDPATGDTRLVEMPQVETRGGMGTSRPYGIKMDSRGTPWIALFNTHMIATVDPATFERTTYELPEGTRPRRLVIDSEDHVWYVDYAQGELGMLDPSTGSVEEWPMPGGSDSRPYGMAIDSADRIWFVESGEEPNYFVGFDPATREFFSRTPLESGGGTVRHMYYDAANNTVWFGADTNTVGRAVLPPTRRTASQ
jgi:virginiamycin B lyase